ncbi:MAG: hypothetical protein Q7J80_15070 [Anaerolineales bacterium]|nr:hypothetical protein [Anaerolineales bacterium]
MKLKIFVHSAEEVDYRAEVHGLKSWVIQAEILKEFLKIILRIRRMFVGGCLAISRKRRYEKNGWRLLREISNLFKLMVVELVETKKQKSHVVARALLFRMFLRPEASPWRHNPLAVGDCFAVKPLAATSVS